MHNIKLTTYHQWNETENKSEFGTFSDLVPFFSPLFSRIRFQGNEACAVSKLNIRETVSLNGRKEHSWFHLATNLLLRSNGFSNVKGQVYF